MRDDLRFKADISEEMDRVNRKKNLIIMGFPETVEGREGEDDDGRLRLLLKQLMDGEPVRIGTVERFGKETGTGKPRPVRIVIENQMVRRNILLKAKRLKERSDTKDVYIVPDLTRAQQGEDKKLRDKLKELRKNGQTNLKIQKGEIVHYDNGEKIVVYMQDQ